MDAAAPGAAWLVEYRAVAALVVLALAALIIRSGPHFLALLLLTLFVTYQLRRDQTAMQEVVDEVKREGQRLDQKLSAEFEVNAREALKRLEDLGAGLLGIILFFSKRIPSDFDEPLDRQPPGTSTGR